MRQELVRYDFRRSERFSGAQLRAMELLYERYARQLGGTLSAYLRTTSIVSVVAIEQLTYAEFLASLPETTTMWSLKLEPVGGIGAIELSPDSAYAVVYAMMGGRGQSTTETRALTEIELSLLEKTVTHMLRALTQEWQALFQLQISVLNRDTRPQMLNVAASSEPLVVGSFALAIGETTGSFNLVIPCGSVEQMGFERTGQPEAKTAQDPVQSDRLYKLLERIPVAVTARLDSSIASTDVLQLRVGDVVSLGSPVATEVDVYATDRKKFCGKLFSGSEGVKVHIERGTG
jgi:flagellar motor switch protein FliM